MKTDWFRVVKTSNIILNEFIQTNRENLVAFSLMSITLSLNVVKVMLIYKRDILKLIDKRYKIL